MKWIKLFEDWNLMESLASAREKYLITNQISDEEFNLIKDLDPSKNFKYVEKMIDVYVKESPSLEELANTFKDFDEMSKKNQLKNSDITSYGSFSDILDTTQNTFSEYKEKIETKAKGNEVDIVYEDDKVLVLIPRTHEAVCKYGSGTKWCITEEDPEHYLNYLSKSITHYFVIMKGLPKSNPNYKMAVSVTEDGGFECNDALDKSIPIEKVLETSGLDKSLFVSNPNPLTLEMKLLNASKSKKGGVEEVKKLISAGADVNANLNNSGNTPLFWAVLRGNVAIAELLISAGADVNAKNIDGMSPLSWAVDGDNVAIAELLISAGADVNAKNKSGDSPLSWAVRWGHITMVKLLISAGADVNAKDNNHNYVLHYVRDVEVAKYLIERGADVNAEGAKKYTPLHIVRNIELAKLFIDSGANIMAEAEYGVTPLHMSVAERSFSISKLLIEVGADPMIKNKFGETPLDFADSERMKSILIGK